MTILLDYEVTETLHTGSRFDLFRARRRSDERPVILKVLKGPRPSAERIARFTHEYQLLQRVSSPHVVKVLGFETDQTRWALIQEDVGAAPISEMVSDDAYTLADRLDVALGIARGLEDLHAHHIIHKDINPSNVVWSRATGDVMIIDLGISTVLSRETPAFFNRNVLAGTLAYISPEQTGRMSAPVDYRSDFYSLGVTLYELFTGALPFTATDPLELVYSHIARQPARPEERAERVPGPLGDIIMKLLEKTAEARYQSAHGVVQDLRRCREWIDDGGEVAAFDVGTDDVSEKLLVPQRLYGRDDEIAELSDALARTVGTEEPATGAVRAGPTQLVLVSGRAGMGKSVLVQQLYRPITERRGYFIGGKFEQFRRTPYSAIVAAFRSLVTELLGESEGRLAAFKEQLTAALGPNGRIITDVIPQVGLIIGPQPRVMELAPQENRNRFNLVFQNFIDVFAKPAHPVVLFIDDLQWADAASLSLVEQLLGDGRPHSLLIVGAYRDNEVDERHPLTMTLGRLTPERASVTRIALKPLAEQHVAELVADTLKLPRAEVAPLGKLVWRNTEGNPLFVTELFRALHDDGLLTFDRQQHRWRWDLAEIEAGGSTESVLQLMIDKLAGLPADTQRTLQLAACAGSRFDLGLLTRIRGDAPADTFESLRPALADGIVVATSGLDALMAEGVGLERHCSFFHDRVQQAAYAMLGEAERVAIHLRLGRLLEERASADSRQDTLFEIVDQLHRGRGLLNARGEREHLARLSLEAGQRALASTAYDAAVRYLGVGLEMLPDTGWSSHYELSLALHRELALAEYLEGNHARSDELTDVALKHAKTPLERAAILVVVVRQCTMSAQYTEALDAMRRGLAELDYAVDDDDLEAAIPAAFGAIQATLDGAAASSLLDRPTMSDPKIIATARLIATGISASFYVDLNLYTLLIFRAMHLALEHGHPPEGLSIYAWYGFLVAAGFGTPQSGYAFGELAVELSDRAGNLQDTCVSNFALGHFVHPWVRSLHDAAALTDAGIQAGLESGELQFGGYLLYYRGHNDFLRGRQLAELDGVVRRQYAVNARVHNTIAVDAGQALQMVIGNLRGETDGPEVFEANGTGDASIIETCLENQTVMGLCYYYIFKSQALNLHGRPELARAALDAAEPLLAAITLNVANSRHAFEAALARCALSEATSGAERATLREELDGYRDKIATWAVGCPENFAHMESLVRAETARLDGDRAGAIEAFEQAIEQATTNRFPQDAARANELAGRFWVSQDRNTLATTYLAAARHGYMLWGAERKVAQLDAAYPQLRDAGAESERALSRRATATGLTDPRSSAAVLDLASVIKASQAISGEIRLERLLERLMELLLENAGAQRGVLVVDTDGALTVQARAQLETVDGEQRLQIQVQEATPLARCPDIAHGVVNYAARTMESVIYDAAPGHRRFDREPHILHNKPKSVLCMPLTKQGQLVGLVYLENRVVSGAFTEDRLEVLRLLAAQFTISFENARLYNEMEQQVERRTAELHSKNVELSTTLEELQTAQSRLVHAEKMASLGKMTAGVAHELNNPLNFINNFADLGVELLDEIATERTERPGTSLADVDELLGDLRGNIDTIRKHGARASGIVSSMLDHARGGASERERTDLNALVEESVEQVQVRLRDRGDDTTVSLALGEGVGPVHLAPREIGRVLVSLLENALDAIDARRAGGVATEPGRVTIRTERREDRVLIQIGDNGTGISEEIRTRIFEPFFTTKAGTEGVGLGLSLCYDIVVSGHGGDIAFDDGAEEGATVTVTLPAAPVASS